MYPSDIGRDRLIEIRSGFMAWSRLVASWARRARGAAVAAVVLAAIASVSAFAAGGGAGAGLQAKPRPISAAAAFVLPSTKRCVSLRELTIRLRDVPHVKWVGVTVKVNGKRAKTVKRSQITRLVKLTGLPLGRLALSITAVTSDRRSVTAKRTYETCAAKLVTPAAAPAPTPTAPTSMLSLAPPAAPVSTVSPTVSDLAEEGRTPSAISPPAPLYSPSSLWNTPVSADPEISPTNATEIKELDGEDSSKGCENQVGFSCLGSGFEYAPTVWYGTSSTQMARVEIDYPKCDAEEMEVPLEPGWVPDPSDEGHMAVLGYNGTEYDFWQGAQPDEAPKSHYSGDKGGTEPPEHSCPTVDVWTAGEVVRTNWKTGLAQEGGVHASNTPEGAGLITQKDLESKASYWPHALAFSYAHNCKETLSWCGRPKPANGTGDGACEEEAVCIPEGARLQLEPSFDCTIGQNEIEYKWEEQWCNTLKQYGMIDVDSSADEPRSGNTGANIFAQQMSSWTNGFEPPWRTEYKTGAALTEVECENVYGLTSPPSPPSWCVGERSGIMPGVLLAHMRVLKW